MAAIAVPVLEILVERIVIALAVAIGGAIVIDGRKKRKEEETPLPPVTIPRTEAPTKTDTKKKCQNCPPECQGKERPQDTSSWSQVSIEYQNRICKMGFGPGYINEWEFNGVSFDGFDASQCLLKEAKAKYDQFFNEFREVVDWWRPGEARLIDEARRQALAAQPRPPVQLKWYFMQAISYRHFSLIIQDAYPDVEVIFEP
jgi:hypothetical protein